MHIFVFCLLQFSVLYFVAFALVVLGLIIYNSKPVPTLPRASQEYDQLENEHPAEMGICCEQFITT